MAANPDGIQVRFSCPVYFTDDSHILQGGTSNYGVDFASSPELGNGSRLRAEKRVDIAGAGSDDVTPAGQCNALLSEDPRSGPQVTSGPTAGRPTACA